ncbi:MAG: hypothetical protein RSE98_06410 [Anaerovoracaceae bacterium]
MNKYYSVLGVSEEATKEEIQAAYEYRTKKYKAADYQDDPEYVHRKTMDLNEAYSAIMGGAASDPEKARLKNSQQRKRIVTKPTSIEGKAKEKFSEVKTDLKDSANAIMKNESLIRGILGTIVAVVVLGFTLFAGPGGESSYEPDYSGSESEIVYNLQDGEIDVYRDKIITGLAVYRDYEETTNDASLLLEESVRFVGDYFSKETVNETVDYLMTEYTYYINPSADLIDEMNQIIQWLGLPSYEGALGYVNPFSDEVINNYVEYLKYLNDAYEDQNKEEA